MKRERLINARVERHLSQREVARAVGVSRTAYVRYETGLRTPTLDVALNIASALESSVDVLFGTDVPQRK